MEECRVQQKGEGVRLQGESVILPSLKRIALWTPFSKRCTSSTLLQAVRLSKLIALQHNMNVFALYACGLTLADMRDPCSAFCCPTKIQAGLSVGACCLVISRLLELSVTGLLTCE